MTEFILDLTQYKDRVGARVDEGRYRVRVEDAEMDKSKAGNAMVNIWLTIIGGEFDGMTLTDRLVLSEKSLFRVVGFMQAIGLPTPKKRLKINLNQFLGKVLDVDVADGDPYNGRTKSEVRGYIKATRSTAEEDATTDDLDDLMEEEEEPTTPAAPAAQEEPEEEYEDDDEYEDEEEEPEPTPPPPPAATRKRRRPAPAVGTATVDEPEVISLDELDLG